MTTTFEEAEHKRKALEALPDHLAVASGDVVRILSAKI